MTSPRTPSQTIGPFFAIGLPWPDGPYVVPEGTPGAIWIRGSVLDGEGTPIPDAMVETWQADPDGRFDHPDDPRGAVAGFRGFGRSSADADGRYGILTMKPGAVPAPDGSPQAPHIDVSVFARGLLKRVITRIYFADEAGRERERSRAVAGVRRRPQVHADRRTDRRRVPLRHPSPGGT